MTDSETLHHILVTLVTISETLRFLALLGAFAFGYSVLRGKR
ncbi:hypothetical protein [Deinococcus aluminii]|uniref:Uncharacterized protein n=1 Tax=Deinococcus aluminii TaxID=1656885 RepID=A0ABP9XKR9_9DEIO